MNTDTAKVDVVLGLQWGDEGKGKIVDVLAQKYNIIARFQGGPNAGHSIQHGGKSFVLHSVPSGIFREGTDNLIGGGVVLDPIIFRQECEDLEKLGVPVRERIRISKKAHLITPTHRIIDAASEASKGKSKIGSTLKGIGPTYMDKTGRNGLRVGDILAPDFQDRFEALKKKHIAFLKQFDYTYDPDTNVKEWMEAAEYLRSFDLVDGEYYINGCLSHGDSVLAEGAQGSMLDVDFGSYPFVTSSTTICSGACLGLGVAPSAIGNVYGIFKAYCTRVGSGPFPTELFDETGEELRRQGHEFGATTGRPRRTGWRPPPPHRLAGHGSPQVRRDAQRSHRTDHDEGRRDGHIRHHQDSHRIHRGRQAPGHRTLRHLCRSNSRVSGVQRMETASLRHPRREGPSR
ncbi:adenylosuccinate synthetase [Alistipes sp. CAG:831]|nr:adenylosuccinate synthetase [Alistipes sp. CAG:831]